MNSTPLLEVDRLTLQVGRTGAIVVNDVSLSLAPGEVLGVVGESGSGKTLLARAVIGLEPPAIRRAAGTIRFEGHDIATMPPKALRALRGNRIGMVFQEPMTSLNPSLTIGRQLEEGLILHRDGDAPARKAAIREMLRRIGIQDPEAALAAYPHQFSGGMRQRIMLASVMLLKPALLIADEPTTALDAVVQREVLELMLELTRDHGTAVLMISHDLSMVARYSDRVAVMCRGDLVEQNTTAELLRRPQQPYTQKLLNAMPHRTPARTLPMDETPIVAVRGLTVDYAGHGGLMQRQAPKRALHGIDIEVRPREVVAVVGGSGSGKTTLGRAIVGLVKPSGGEILFAGRPIARSDEGWRHYRLNCQMVFQDPYASLDPRMTIGQLVGEALRQVPGLGPADKVRRIAEGLEEVGLERKYIDRYPHELSGGQRQRVAIARAVVRRPSFVIADEPVSALDVTVRAQVLALFVELQQRHGFSCLFISHDLGVVEQVADRVVVMRDGRIIEQGDRDTVFDHPREAYTRTLLSAIPALEPESGGGVRLKWRFENDARTSGRG
ncbi:MAG TPA: ABC transporter ATP-binding protein [Aliidongia sp.]|uniref:ABC transporter ATP-binding protein n=1 Tax=Aliidongia sp. TaxID=1914230 RepID=UPI002DDD7C43|nr:ABC transporter ATP-binding protein [Aliidongia sp.]HEV2674985.1 ABC transporter ATP-binding protein [Aliidongia sp.]